MAAGGAQGACAATAASADLVRVAPSRDLPASACARSTLTPASACSKSRSGNARPAAPRRPELQASRESQLAHRDTGGVRSRGRRQCRLSIDAVEAGRHPKLRVTQAGTGPLRNGALLRPELLRVQRGWRIGRQSLCKGGTCPYCRLRPGHCMTIAGRSREGATAFGSARQLRPRLRRRVARRGHLQLAPHASAKNATKAAADAAISGWTSRARPFSTLIAT
jgi:hypothetical protein